MKKLILFSLIYFTNIVYSQSLKHEYIGILNIKNMNMIVTYKIEFEVKDNIINGISYSDIGKENETHARIVGTLEGENISFREVEILYPVLENHSYCLIAFEGKRNTKNNTNSFAGEFNGYLNGDQNNICAKGNIMISSKEKILELSHDYIKKDVFSIKKVEPLTKGKRFEFHTEDDKFSLKLIDSKPDGDKLSMHFNEKEIFFNEEITGTAKEFSVNSKEVKTIKLTSTSNGKEPPNTSEIILKDSQREQRLNLEIDVSETIWIDIIKH